MMLLADFGTIGKIRFHSEIIHKALTVTLFFFRWDLLE